MMAQDHTLMGIDGAAGPDKTGILLVTEAAIPDGDVATLHQICEFRGEQISKRDHTPEADAGLPAAYLPRKAREYLEDAIDLIHRGKPDLAITKLLKAGALILAAVARIRMKQEG